jgi:hypothetical protein
MGQPMPEEKLDPNEPYCGACGYRLSGCVDSAKCPECGRPIVEVLTRGGQWGRRFRSRTTLFGWPIVDIAMGPGPGERIGKARGIIAIGDSAVGMLAIGGFARGIVACGGMSIGLFTMGGLTIGLLTAFGGLALGGLVSGGAAFGGLVSGGLAFGFFASGGLPVGYYAAGGAPVAFHAIGPGVNSPEAIEMWSHLNWYFGQGGAWIVFQPMIIVVVAFLAAAAAIALLAVLGHLRGRVIGPSLG